MKRYDETHQIKKVGRLDELWSKRIIEVLGLSLYAVESLRYGAVTSPEVPVCTQSPAVRLCSKRR